MCKESCLESHMHESSNYSNYSTTSFLKNILTELLRRETVGKAQSASRLSIIQCYKSGKAQILSLSSDV